jgi:hypothetical protein
LLQELAAASAARDAAAVEAERVIADAANVLAAADIGNTALTDLQQENAVLQQQIDHYRGSVPWLWAASALIVALGIGITAGYWWLDASIRRRHGGFRVH